MNSPVAPQSKSLFRATEQEGFAEVFIEISTRKESPPGDKALTERTGGKGVKQKLDASRHTPPTASGHLCLKELQEFDLQGSTY